MELDGFKDLEQQRQAREDFFEKSFDPTYIEKGKRGGTGEIREWKDGKYQKQSDGTWKPVKEGGRKSEDKSTESSEVFREGDIVKLTDSAYKEVQSAEDSSGMGSAISGFSKFKRDQTFHVHGYDGSNLRVSPDGKQVNIISINEKRFQQAGSKKEEPKKSEQKYPAEKKQLFDDVREWSGEDIKDEQINAVYEELYGRRGEMVFSVKRESTDTVESFHEKVNRKGYYLVENYSEVIRRKLPINKSEIRDIIWGIVMSKNN